MEEARTFDPFGDFQTPLGLASSIWQAVDVSGVDIVVEPTVGEGSFLATTPESYRHLPWVAYDIDSGYAAQARKVAKDRSIRARVECRDTFRLEKTALNRDVDGKTVLAIGNPPWVTNSAQGASPASNLPTKFNRFGLRGLDAMTGKANFDIAEAILLAVLAALSSAAEVRFAFLVKRSVAVKMAKDVLGTPGLLSATFSRIDAQKWFGASVEAGLFQLTFRPANITSTDRLLLADTLNGPFTTAAGLVDGAFVSDLACYAAASAVEAGEDGRLVWRQGVKHDLSKILELQSSASGFVNGLGEKVDIEDEILCPFFKSSDIAKGGPTRRWFPLYQHDLSGPLSDLPRRWPKLASYLRKHHKRFAARGSSIYRGKPDFMLFGVGTYTLAPFKVAISGFYKEPRFTLLRPDEAGRPPLVDDTCYILPFDKAYDAEMMVEYLNGMRVQDFLRSVADTTAKRPYTKEILGRIASPGLTGSNAKLLADLR